MSRFRAVMEIHLHFQNVENERMIREVDLNSEYYSGDFGLEYIKQHLLNDCSTLENTIKGVNINKKLSIAPSHEETAKGLR